MNSWYVGELLVAEQFVLYALYVCVFFFEGICFIRDWMVLVNFFNCDSLRVVLSLHYEWDSYFVGDSLKSEWHFIY